MAGVMSDTAGLLETEWGEGITGRFADIRPKTEFSLLVDADLLVRVHEQRSPSSQVHRTLVLVGREGSLAPSVGHHHLPTLVRVFDSDVASNIQFTQ